jgi:TetR/AcrR family transcriptional regulator
MDDAFHARHADTAVDDAQPGRIRVRNRAQILRAAEEVFAERGYGGATTAAIAERAGLPKANVHYYFGTKEKLYRAVLDSILELWLGAMDKITADKHPAEALGAYIRDKVLYSRDRPLASRLYASEVILGGTHIRDFLEVELRRWVAEKGEVIDAWVAQGRMQPVDPVHLFSLIWATTQHYADFHAQVATLVGRSDGQLSDADYEAAAETITRMVLKGCGVKGKSGKAAD